MTKPKYEIGDRIPFTEFVVEDIWITQLGFFQYCLKRGNSYLYRLEGQIPAVIEDERNGRKNHFELYE